MMNKLIQIDCNDYMKDIPDNHFDLAVVDPPYGIGMSGGNVGYKGFNNLERKKWDNKKPDPSYWRELFRISKNQIVWGGNYFALSSSRCYLIWDKGEGFKNRTYAEAELAWTSFDKNIKIFKHDPLAKGDYKGKIHPTQKPVALYKWLLTNYAKPGFKLFDSHSGSGSFRIAAYDMGFDLVSCELDADYCRDNEARYQRHIQQIDLFQPEELQKYIYRDKELIEESVSIGI